MERSKRDDDKVQYLFLIKFKINADYRFEQIEKNIEMQ